MGTNNAINLKQPGIAIYDNSLGRFVGLPLMKGQLLTFDGTANQYAVLPIGTNGKFLSANSAQDTGLEWVNAPGGSGFTSINQQIFTSSGTYIPTSNMKYCLIEVFGGGGGGGGVGSTSLGTTVSVGGGGAAGNYNWGFFSAATIGASKTVTIGPGGTGVSNGVGNQGGMTSVGSLISATGGAGGSPGNAAASSSGQGGANIFSGLDYIGAPGMSSFANVTSGVARGFSGAGGSNRIGAGGQSLNANTDSVSGNVGIFGGGGSGASASNIGTGPFAGGQGGSGIVIITEYI
jgi:hypothetical protein